MKRVTLSSAVLTALLTAANATKTVTVTTHIPTTLWRTKTHTQTVHPSCPSSSTSPTSSSAPLPYPPPNATYWHGWPAISHMIVFGDSYTTTGFNVSGAQPSVANPLGNPPYPGYTATNGPNWVDFLTTTYNKSFIETINLAYGGATVDSALVAPYLPTVLSLKEQVETEYLPLYAGKPAGYPWSSENTLFALFLGINDVGNAYYRSNSSDIFAAEFKVYASLVDTLYSTGARNFLFLNVPPVDRSPLTAAQGAASQAAEKVAIAAWNANVTALAANLTKSYKDATAFVFDTNAAFTQVLDNPASHVETAPCKNTTGYCDAYMNGTPTWYTFNASCTYSVDEYFWLNSLHPTFRMMNVTAQEIVQQLS
ncbi:hypothetical protein B0A48_15786 [Cryoendolithus antarcticus]|uniref:SGNH hydrolase-type esterase domain-containing protein n=1 Tax=Cryoendolithus antarcticus TaxID=1507870 RepID=A0A1V8SHA7_9PEZI|nr:hypothetical protein B0A48_15786 [Cryoendolithus antarcticus]